MEENLTPIPEERPKVPFVARGAEFLFGGLILLLSILLCGCISYQDPVRSSLPGEGVGQMYTHGKFQDYTDYGKYRYIGITEEILQKNSYFRVVSAEDIPVLESYLDDFEEWVMLSQDCEDCELAEMYDFSSGLFREGDFFCIADDDNSMTNYNIYYFSLETQTLYYFHNNI